jgi:hypothetical protein
VATCMLQFFKEKSARSFVLAQEASWMLLSQIDLRFLLFFSFADF